MPCKVPLIEHAPRAAPARLPGEQVEHGELPPGSANEASEYGARHRVLVARLGGHASSVRHRGSRIAQLLVCRVLATAPAAVGQFVAEDVPVSNNGAPVYR